MLSDLLEKQDQLTKAQKQVLKYILDHSEEAVFLTAASLSQKAGVSEATVVRLAQVLGFDGYPDLQRRIREEFQDRFSTVSRFQETAQIGGTEGDILLNIMQEDIRNLSQTLRDISVDTFREAVKDIDGADRIFVVGLRGAHAPALVLALYLRFLKKDARLILPGTGDVWNNIFGVGSRDLVVGISFPRYTRLTVEILEYAKQEGARVGAITDSLLSPLAEFADWVLPVYSRLDSFIESFAAPMSLVNALLTAVSVQDLDKTVQTLKERETLWKDKKIYLSTAAPAAHRRLDRMRAGLEKS
ncbi:MAG: MurR/RpiR family transcriptional regulator [Desulfobacterales bacterium]